MAVLAVNGSSFKFFNHAYIDNGYENFVIWILMLKAMAFLHPVLLRGC